MEIAVVFVDFFSGGQCYATQVFSEKNVFKPISLENSRGMSQNIWIFSTISVSRIPPNDMINCKFHWG